MSLCVCVCVCVCEDEDEEDKDEERHYRPALMVRKGGTYFSISCWGFGPETLQM